MKTYSRARKVAKSLGGSRPVEVDGNVIVDGYRGSVVRTEFRDLEDRLSVFDVIDWVSYNTLTYPPWIRVYGRVDGSPVMLELNVNWGNCVRAGEEVADELKDLGSVTVIHVPEIRVSDDTAWPATTRFVLSHMTGLPNASQTKRLDIDDLGWVVRARMHGAGTEVLVGIGDDLFPVEMEATEEVERRVTELAEAVDGEVPVTMTYPGRLLCGVAGPGFKVGVVGRETVVAMGEKASKLAKLVKDATGARSVRVAEVR